MLGDCEPLGLSEAFPLERWLRLASSMEPQTSGYVVLAGNASAHDSALRCWLQRAASGGSELRHLTGDAWHVIDCSGGCPSLLDEVAASLNAFSGLWRVFFIRAAESAPPAQLGTLSSRFLQQARCTYATASAKLDADCRRVVFALSTSWGADALSQPDARDRPRHRLTNQALIQAAPWLNAAAAQLTARQRLRAAVAIVLGEAPADRFAALMSKQDAARHASMGPPNVHTSSGKLPDLAAFDHVSGHGAIVSELRDRFRGIASGADGGEDAHTFFFYGFPGTGKTFLAERVALAQHGTTAPPHYQRFSMQNYKTDEDMWKLVSPPCGVKGEGAFAALFASRVGCGQASSSASEGTSGDVRCNAAAPVVLFDEVEEARADFMTSALVNAIDHRGFVEFSRKTADGQCVTEQARTAGAFIILTSNCFMDDLAEVLRLEKGAGRTEADVYAAVRKEMDRRIFDLGIPCDASGTPSPFASRKMRDRMRGNVYPFLPLTDEQMINAFEAQLHERARAYNASRGVRLYWTSDFAELIVEQSGRGRDAYLRAVGLRQDTGIAASESRMPDGEAQVEPVATNGRHQVRTIADAPSLRKRIEHLMRLDERSVERLYARAAEQCAGDDNSNMARLVLYVANGLADAWPICTAASTADKISIEPQKPLASNAQQPNRCHAVDGDRAGRHACRGRLPYSASIAEASTWPGTTPAQPPVAPDLDMSIVVSHASHADVAVKLALQKQAESHAMELARAKHREEELMMSMSHLQERVSELQAQLLRWQLACAAMVVLATLLFLGLGHLALAYTAAMVKMAAIATAVSATAVTAVYAAVALLCYRGVQFACSIEALMQEGARWVLWALRLSLQLLGSAWSLIGGLSTHIAVAIALVCAVATWRAHVHDRSRNRRREEHRLATERRIIAATQAARACADVQLRVVLEELRDNEACMFVELPLSARAALLDVSNHEDAPTTDLRTALPLVVGADAACAHSRQQEELATAAPASAAYKP